MTVTISGSGTIAGITSGGLGSNPIITQPEIVTGVAGTGPAFSAYCGATQTIANNTATKLQVNTKEFDTANCYDATTNYRFTPNVAGYYYVTLANGFASATYPQLYLYKNGSQFKTGNYGGSTTGGIQIMVLSVLVYLNGTTDYIEPWIYQSTGSSQTTIGGSANGYFQAVLVRSA